MSTKLMPEIKSSGSNSDLANRLRAAVRLGGGNKAVAAKSGVPLGTLNNYVREVHRVPPDAAAKIAGACNVSIDWLLRGEGPMEYLPVGAVTKEGHVVVMGEAQPIAPEPHLPDEFIKTFNPDRLARALKAAEAMFVLENRQPTHRQLVQVMILLYNKFTEEIAEFADKQSQNSVDSGNENPQS